MTLATINKNDFTVNLVEKEIFTVNLITADIVRRKIYIDELEDVDLTGLSNNNLLKYNINLNSWMVVSQLQIIKESIVRNEIPTKLSDTDFETSYNFEDGSLEVLLNGLKEKTVTKLSDNTFRLTDPIITGDRIEVNYLKKGQ